GFLWFFMLFLAAITSSVSMLQPAIAFLEEALPLGRKASVTFLGLISALGSFFVLYFSKDLKALDTMDFWVGTFLIFVLATVTVILFGWIIGVDHGLEIAEEGAEMKIPRPYRFILKYVSPVYLLAIFVGWCTVNLPDYIKQIENEPVALLSLGVVASVFIFLALILSLAHAQWDKKEAS
ncbi:MAG: hypothetical protein KDD44_12150, partial [Bdellovibrionales bacterium]|nr:hypothetical protein [Bdellovibrionales bacterium]